MSETETETEPTAVEPGDGQAPGQQPHGHGLAYALVAVFLAALGFGAWGIWATFGPHPANARATLQEQGLRIADLEQQVATLSRSDQISRDANRDLEGTLAERDEEIAALRADVAFYERFVGSTAQRHGLTVHQLQLEPQAAAGAWHFTATLTQNLNRGAVNTGKLTLSVEGTRAGKLEELDWSELREGSSTPGVDYSFKYFQQVEGDILLPEGLQPIRVTVQLDPARGAAVEQSFTWEVATAGPQQRDRDAGPG